MFKETSSHYLEAYNGNKDKPIYIGHLSDVLHFSHDVVKYGEKSPYFGCIFSPERDKDGYSYQKNMDWMLGGIHGGRQFKLASTLMHYQGSIENKIDTLKKWRDSGLTLSNVRVVNDKTVRSFGVLSNVGVTLDEIRWLVDFGYTFKKDANNPAHTIAIPPLKPVNREMVAYDGLLNRSLKNPLYELTHLKNMLNSIASQRLTNSMNNEIPKTAPTLSSTYRMNTQFSLPDVNQIILAPQTPYIVTKDISVSVTTAPVKVEGNEVTVTAPVEDAVTIPLETELNEASFKNKEAKKIAQPVVAESIPVDSNLPSSIINKNVAAQSVQKNVFPVETKQKIISTNKIENSGVKPTSVNDTASKTRQVPNKIQSSQKFSTKTKSQRSQNKNNQNPSNTKKNNQEEEGWTLVGSKKKTSSFFKSQGQGNKDQVSKKRQDGKPLSVINSSI